MQITVPITPLIEGLIEYLKRLERAIVEAKARAPQSIIDRWLRPISPPPLRRITIENHDFPPLNPPPFEDYESTARDTENMRQDELQVVPIDNYYEWRIQVQEDTDNTELRALGEPSEHNYASDDIDTNMEIDREDEVEVELSVEADSEDSGE